MLKVSRQETPAATATSHYPTERALQRWRVRFLAVVGGSYLAAPLVAYAIAVLYGLPQGAAETQVWLGAFVAVVALSLMAGAARYFSVFAQPILAWLQAHPTLSSVPPKLHRRLRWFSAHYWGLHLLFALVAPWLYEGLGFLASSSVDSSVVIGNFMVLQLATALLLGLPAYIAALNSLGRLAAWVGLDRIHVSLRYKLFVQVGFLPLFAGTVLAQYYWWQEGHMTLESTLLWAGLGLVTLTTAFLSIRGLDRALGPLRDLLEGKKEVRQEDVARLRPQSVDEIGYLTQMLARLLTRLGDQDAQVRTIVDSAAEGIIVADDGGRVELFNHAAEKLFGYHSEEVRGRPLAWLLPSVVSANGVPVSVAHEQEVDGVHNRGRKIPMSVRMSEYTVSGRKMYAFLVADISERKAGQRKLLEAEARYRHLVETAHDLVWSMDLQARWTYLNKAAKLIYGLEPSEMLGHFVREYQVDEYSEQDLSAFKEILKGKELVQYETAHRDRNGNVHFLSFNAKAFRDAQGNVAGISGTARDITEKKAFERQLAYQAQHDSLTGLANRRQFQEELDRLVARVARSGTTCALLYIDMDQFKYVNDTAGHAAGDRLLIEFSRLLKTCLRESDLLARFGGDEFTVLAYNVDKAGALHVAENLRNTVEQYRFLDAGTAYNISCSIGIAMIDNSSQSVDECMAHADLACHLAKTQGRNRCYLYQAQDESKLAMQADIGWAARLKDSLENNRLQLVFQPIASVADGSVRDYEVLARMICDDGQIILPGGFMPAAERFGLISQVDRWMVDRAITKLAELHRGGEQVRFSINLSARALEDAALLDLIHTRLAETGLSPHLLTFEITETAAIGNLPAAVEFIGALKEIGCQFALDDFGSGFSSFAYLKHLPVDKLKIDGSFVQNMVGNEVDQAMVQSMNQVAHALGKHTIAEFVENAETYELVRRLGIDYAQGYFLGKPGKILPVGFGGDRRAGVAIH